MMTPSSAEPNTPAPSPREMFLVASPMMPAMTGVTRVISTMAPSASIPGLLMGPNDSHGEKTPITDSSEKTSSDAAAPTMMRGAVAVFVMRCAPGSC
ncbi:MAG: hypothetical protein CVU56_15705 [Deltaproteobacteria bacterium HGW-Deltaproteobacteria-14]|nr:MAG: hypothetical protein CVU56_15705 [Deltaproteobacteria bacterium HGW-Deltaproteobacteria-14]